MESQSYSAQRQQQQRSEVYNSSTIFYSYPLYDDLIDGIASNTYGKSPASTDSAGKGRAMPRGYVAYYHS
jgi:hypothetical protein